MIKLQKNLFKGNYPLSQLFGVNPAAYAKFGLKGHNGIDYAIPTGTELYSCINGKVLEAQLDKTGYGNYIKIENNYCGVIYGHLKSFSVKVGDTVTAGQLIGISNNTGNSTGPHLHFGVYPIPRDRNNGFAGYIDPFDKKLIEWVDKISEEKPIEVDQKVFIKQDINSEIENKLKLKDIPRYSTKWSYENIITDWIYTTKAIDVLNNSLQQEQNKYDNISNEYNKLLNNYNSISKVFNEANIQLDIKDKEITRLKKELLDAPNKLSIYELILLILKKIKL